MSRRSRFAVVFVFIDDVFFFESFPSFAAYTAFVSKSIPSKANRFYRQGTFRTLPPEIECPGKPRGGGITCYAPTPSNKQRNKDAIQRVDNNSTPVSISVKALLSFLVGYFYGSQLRFNYRSSVWYARRRKGNRRRESIPDSPIFYGAIFGRRDWPNATRDLMQALTRYRRL